MTIAWCVKCRKKKEMKSISKTKVNGRNMLKGKCSTCSTNMCKFI